MKRLLPTKISSGFTLVELMVVIAILAILALVGISIYGNAQRNARDGVRRAEITSIGKSIETAREATSSAYTYGSTHFAADFPQNKPGDPLKSTTAPFYCISTNAAAGIAPPTNPTSWSVTTNCPADAGSATQTPWGTLVNSTSVYNTISSTNALQVGNVKYWKVCARLEVSGNPYCIGSSQP